MKAVEANSETGRMVVDDGRPLGRLSARPAAKVWPVMVPVLSLAALLLLWQIAALIAGHPQRLPAPMAVFERALEELASGDLTLHLGATLARVGASFVVAMVIGTAIGLAMGRMSLVDQILHPWLVFLLNIPALVIIILCYIWIGLVEASVIVAVAMNKIPNVVVTVREGARALDRDLLEMAHSFRIGWQKTLIHVVLPQLYPYLAAASRSGLALIWKIVLVTELLGRSSGVGFQIGTFFSLFDVTSILAYALAFIAVIQLIEWCILMPLERHVTRWRR